MSAAPWIVDKPSRPDARIRLLCFHHAGGGTSVFRRWQKHLPSAIDVCPVCLPGRDHRRGEAPFRRLVAVVRALTDVVGGNVAAPFALFGHSMGALVAFAFTCELRRRGLAGPDLLLVSGRRAPQVPAAGPWQRPDRLSDADLVAWLQTIDALPVGICAEPELLRLFLPTLRADLAVAEGEALAPDAPLACGIAAFGGTSDPLVPEEHLRAWRAQTTGSFTVELFPGGHFFLDAALPRLLATIAGLLLAPAGAPGDGAGAPSAPRFLLDDGAGSTPRTPSW